MAKLKAGLVRQWKEQKNARKPVYSKKPRDPAVFHPIPAILVFLFACVGFAALLWPESRNALLHLLDALSKQFKAFIS